MGAFLLFWVDPLSPVTAKNAFQRWQAYGLMVLSGVLLACAPIVDGEKVGRRLHQEFEHQTAIAVHSVQCPKNVESKVGRQFTCKIYALDGKTLNPQVTLKTNKDDFSWSVQTGLLDLGVIEADIEKTFAVQHLSQVQASCQGRFKIAHLGDTFKCQVQKGQEALEQVRVQVADQAGNVRFQGLERPATPPQNQRDRPSAP